MSLTSFISNTVNFAKKVGIDVKQIYTRIGNLSSLSTAHKTDLVGAINEVNGYVYSLNQQYHYNFQYLETINQHVNVGAHVSFGKINLNGDPNDPTHYIWRNPANDFDEINVSTGFQIIDYNSGSTLFRATSTENQSYKNLTVPDAQAGNHAINFGQLKKYGLATDPTLDLNIDTDTNVTRFLGVVPWTLGTLPFAWGNIINMSYGNGVEFSQIAVQQGQDVVKFRNKDGTGNMKPWRTFWHDGNFNPDTKVNSWDNATAIGFTNGNASGLPYFYHSSGVHKYLATVDYINAQGYTTEGWVLQQISNSASPYRYFQGNIFSDTPNFSNNTINGKGNQALGSYILHKGSRSTLIGDHIVSEGNYINAIGRRGSFSGGYLNSYGAYNTATGAHINLFGNYLVGSKSNYTAIGNYNKIDLLNPEKEQNKVVVIGSGKSEYERENAIEIYTDNSSGFRGKAFYDEETRSPDWFGEQGTLVDTTVAGMHHLEDRAISYNLDAVENLIGVCDRGFGTTYYKSISGDEECLCPLGLVDGLNFGGGLFNPDKVHRTGTIKYNLQQSYVLSEKFAIGYGSAYLVVIYTEDDRFFESVRVLNYGEITFHKGMGQMCRILGSFIKVTTPEGPQVYFEFNHITLT